MATLVDLLGKLRELPPRTSDAETAEALWSYVLRLLSEEQQFIVARFDAWLQRIDDALDGAAGGDVVKLIELGIKVLDRRSQALQLEPRSVITPLVDPAYADAIDRMMDKMNGPSPGSPNREVDVPGETPS